ncbi:(deoxy)nucleoside triphosphate pyrophosphohydrolase [Enterococcus pseudoavium]|mgnify:CR=1 FL=1|uniref:8-oxo-dGTP diphosphatase n=1 Tax=Enterococcus pseudoavium TaxID=44007 RepID=A0AAE4HYY4_9ENTE|nr:(deoxy)nucleoside triphosphate pyrophosphohydrolase [Enterococcus pseudoavium]MDT2736404.1 (deoxy)nucleoside triphosphate pyrophosphohydrolase [Enterococcus pseudoavium]MDT2755480.1 (deoxy)nucleoside triphosphate pyrophosphohydrolase [Enterococcus pseudoavium]MDT2771702.1 (deoxy)nucleoside triphosphate pyrophosphohydrolase [Enterococcus pseudoavium]
MKKTIEVVGAIIIDNGKILCAQRGPEKSLANFWEFPGGKVEANETPIEALKREVVEELLITVTIEDQAFESTKYEYDFGSIHLTTFICHLQQGEPKLTEHEAIVWLPVEELESLEWAPADIPTVEKLKTIKL